MVTVVLDAYAPVAIWDAVVPFLSSYRRLWTGLGTLALDLALTVLATSTLIRALGHRTWRWLHWLSYAAWPLALLHAVGTGTDGREWWALMLLAAALALAVGATLWRLCGRSMGTGALDLGVRAIGAAALVCGALGLLAFTAAGPLQPGWARTAGTPLSLLNGPPAQAPSPSQNLPGGLDDGLSGGPAQLVGAGRDVHLVDVRDPSLAVDVKVANATPYLAGITVLRAGTVMCVVTSPLNDVLTGSCGGANLTLTLNLRAGGDVVGGLSTTTIGS